MRAGTYLVIVSITAVSWTLPLAQDAQRQWLAGDSHIHSHWSAGYDETQNPPTPRIGSDAVYSTPINAQQARRYGLSWMVTTDHGGPYHSKINLEQAYAELLTSRKEIPDVLQFYGMELNMPGMDHHTLIIPNSQKEASMLYDIERGYDSRDVWPIDPARNSEAHAVRALEYMKGLPLLPLMFANHPSRSAKGVAAYGLDEPREIRRNNDIAPEVYRGMEGAPGHQAGAFRGSYANAGAHTFGGFDQMTAIVGGFWDSMLGEGRRFWILATSDSHSHYSDAKKPGSDFWPGEYQKTYVHAQRSYEGILDGLRSGRIFAVAGDLISSLDVEVTSGQRVAGIGQTLTVPARQPASVIIRFRDPEATNAHGDNPTVARVDLIVGDVSGRTSDQTTDRNPTTRVLQRFTEKEWIRKGDVVTISATLPSIERNHYLRVRGTSTGDLEPPMDAPGESPWTDLWFYSNPVFVEVARK